MHWLFSLIPIATQADPVEFSIIVNGAEAGSCVITREAGKHIESVSKLSTSGLEIHSKLSAKFLAGKPSSAKFIESYKQGAKLLRAVEIEVAEGKATIKTSDLATPTTLPNIVLSSPMMGNLHPQITERALASINFSQKKQQSAKFFWVDGMAALDIKVTPIGKETLMVLGKPLEAYRATISVGRATGEAIISMDGTLRGWEIPSQKTVFVQRGFERAFADPMAKYPELSQKQFATKQTEIDFEMRDGVKLRATVVQPTAPGKYPVILSRTPYGRKASVEASWAQRGYVMVSQDVRGTGESKGKFDPMVSERADGYDTLDLISKQDWCDGNVGMIGASYGGFVQWAAAIEGHPVLKCIVPQVSPPASAMRNIPYENGVFMLYPNIWWLRLVDNPDGQNLLTVTEPVTAVDKLNTLPLNKTDDRTLGFNSPVFETWLKREGEKYWPTWSFEDKLAGVRIPTLHISGWFDGDGIGTKRNWSVRRAAGVNNQWLIYGPWSHAFNSGTTIADVDFGPGSLLDLDQLYLRWFDTWLKGKSVGLDKQPKSKFFVTGANKWIDASDFPTKESRLTTMYMRFKPGMKRFVSHSNLENTPSASKTAYTYEPKRDYKEKSNPKESLKIDEASFSKPCVILTSSALKKNTGISGPFSVKFGFKSSAVNTDFFASVYDLAPSGKYWMLGLPAKLRATYLQDLAAPRALKPGVEYRVELEPWDFAHEFKKGHKIAVVISSSLFPMANRNLGTMDALGTAVKGVNQTNTLVSTLAHPASFSYYTLWEN